MFTINDRPVGPEHPPYVVAELSANHQGSLRRAIQTIEAAKRCGADAVKLQTYTADSMTIPCDRQDFLIEGGLWDGYRLYDLYQQAHTPWEWHPDLFEYARQLGITIFSTPFDQRSVDQLQALQSPAFKIASFELTDLALIRYAAGTGKPLILSTGLASEAEIAEGVAAAREGGCEQLLLLHCVSSYPALMEQANLRKIPKLAQRFQTPVGLSDHTLGSTAGVAAIPLGCCLIEKHFMLDRTEPGPDSPFSLVPEQLAELCHAVRAAWLGLGDGGWERSDREKENLQFRRSLYFVRDLAKGAVVTEEYIRSIRPGYGLPPRYFDELIGRRLNQDVSAGTPADWSLFEED
jgi:pseudaminic acid synthase